MRGDSFHPGRGDTLVAISIHVHQLTCGTGNAGPAVHVPERFTGSRVRAFSAVWIFVEFSRGRNRSITASPPRCTCRRSILDLPNARWDVGWPRQTQPQMRAHLFMSSVPSFSLACSCPSIICPPPASFSPLSLDPLLSRSAPSARRTERVVCVVHTVHKPAYVCECTCLPGPRLLSQLQPYSLFLAPVAASNGPLNGAVGHAALARLRLAICCRQPCRGPEELPQEQSSCDYNAC